MSDVAIIGAGVIGLTLALRLLDDGRDVTLIDPAPPGSGASYGNAGTIADYAVHPVGTPQVLRNLPSLLFNRASPLAIRPGSLPSLAPWLLRFARQSLPGPAARNARALATLVADAAPRWRALITAIGAQDLMRDTGCLYLYDHPGQLRAAQADAAQRRALGARMDLLGPAELAALEPGLPPMAGAALFPGTLSLRDPGAVMARLAARVLPRCTLIAAPAHRLTPGPGGTRLTGPGLDLTAKVVVIAAGAHSRALAAQAGDRVPLDTERGYHVEWDGQDHRLTRPACLTSRGFYLCPMQGRLRAVGTVELGGLTAPPSAHRIEKLIEGARKIFPDLGAPDHSWMGFRPSLPDSLPVIGPARAPGIFHAFGHGHIGITLAPLTAEIVACLIAGTAPPLDIAPLSPRRFQPSGARGARSVHNA